MKNELQFVNKVVKQGNSFCVRIPKMVIKEFELKQSDEVVIKIQPQKYLYNHNEEYTQQLLEVTNKIPKLDKFSETKKRLFLMLNSKFLEETKDPNSEVMKIKKIRFIKEKKSEFGDNLIKEFVEFGSILNKEAFTEDKKGMSIIKPIFKKGLKMLKS